MYFRAVAVRLKSPAAQKKAKAAVYRTAAFSLAEFDGNFLFVFVGC